MLSIGNKTYRNLQEQVGWNAEQIENIKTFLDGINVSDNVVVVLDISTPLTAEELEIVNREVSFIAYNGELYFKRNQDASNIYFDVIFSVSGSTVITLASSEITVVKATGGMTLASASKEVYSKAQIDTLLGAKADTSYVSSQLALKANLSGANFTGSITAPEITETMASGYYYIKDAISGLTNEEVYAGVVKTGNKITFVIATNLTKTASLAGNKNFCHFGMPSAIASKIYPTTIGGFANNVVVYNQFNAIDEDDNVIPIDILILKSVNELYINFRSSTINNLPLNKKAYLRIEFTILLSDPLN